MNSSLEARMNREDLIDHVAAITFDTQSEWLTRQDIEQVVDAVLKVQREEAQSARGDEPAAPPSPPASSSDAARTS